MDWIDDTVAVGNWLDAFSARRRRSEGVEYMIDARLLFTKNLFPSRRKPLVERLWRVRDQLVDISELKPKVLIFCNRGRDRSSFVAMLYASKRFGLSYQDAYEMVRAKRKVTAFHWDWVEAVDRNRPI